MCYTSETRPAEGSELGHVDALADYIALDRIEAFVSDTSSLNTHNVCADELSNKQAREAIWHPWEAITLPKRATLSERDFQIEHAMKSWTHSLYEIDRRNS